MPKKRKRVVWSAAQVRTLKAMAKKKENGQSNREIAQARGGLFDCGV